jgi:hypothetical protein
VKLIIFALIPLIFSIGIIPAISLNVNADYIENYSLPYVLDPLTDSQIEECESIHKDFVSLSDSDFYTRYLNNSISGNCVMLFEDELWNYEDSDRYEKLSERSAELVQERETKLKQSRETFHIDAISLTELQISGTFLFEFEGCTGDQIINAKDISVVSDIETVLLTKFAGEEREITSGSCNKVEIQIKADNPNSIKVVISSLDIEIPAKIDESIIEIEVDESEIIYKSPRAQMHSGIAPTEVICKDGFELLLKKTDGSPACVTAETAEKLIERGWANP